MKHSQPIILWLIGGLTLAVWLYPPVERIRKNPHPAPPSISFSAEPAFQIETGSAGRWLWTLRPEHNTWYAMLLARTFFVWTIAIVAWEIARCPASAVD